MRRQLVQALPAVAIAVLVIVFIALPLAAVLVRSVVVEAPMAYGALREATRDALDRLDSETRAGLLERWREQASPQQRIEAYAAALAHHGTAASWDRRATFDAQLPAIDAVLADLDPDARARVEDEMALATAALHRRAGLAFRVRDQLSPDAFERLRSGVETRLGLDRFAQALGDPRVMRATVNSLKLALLSALITTALAYALAYAITRRLLPAAGALRFVILLPIVSPPMVLAIALILLFGRNGLVTAGVLDRTLGLISAEHTNIYGFSGLLLSQVFGFLPAAFIVVDSVLEKQDGRLEEAAASQGAGPWQVFRHVTLPMSEPGIVRAFLLVFILAMTDFGNPEVIGENVPYLAGLIYDEIIGFQNYAIAAVLALWLIAPGLLAYLAFETLRRRRRFHGEASPMPSALPVPRAARAMLCAVATLVAGYALLLYGTVAAGAFMRGWGFDFSFTLANFSVAADIHAPTESARGPRQILRTLEIVAIAAPLGGVLGALTAWVVDRLRPPGARVIGFLALLPAVLPGLVFGIGYVLAFNAPLGLPALSLTGTGAILVANILFGHMYVGVLAGRATLARVDPAIEEAAASLGAGPLRRFVLVVVPLLRHAFVLGALFVFIDGMTTLSAVFFLVTPDHTLASVRIFQLAMSGHYGLACAMATLVMAVVLAAMALAALLRRGPRRPRRGKTAATIAVSDVARVAEPAR